MTVRPLMMAKGATMALTMIVGVSALCVMYVVYSSFSCKPVGKSCEGNQMVNG